MSAAELTIVEQTGSTNDDVKELGRTEAPHGSAVAAHEQTAGRGRRGHVWHSPKGGLYLSILLRPDVPMQYFTGIPAVCSLGIYDALLQLGCEGVSLKWPNDVVVGASKLVGILVEGGYSEGGTFAVCGLGLNISAPELIQESIENSNDGSAAPLKPACLEEVLPENTRPSFEELAELIRDCVVARVDAWSAEVIAGRATAGPLAPILSEYFDYVSALGKEVEVLSPTGQLIAQGRFAGIDVWGRATVVLPDGSELEVTSEQASLRELFPMRTTLS